jgi:hypothetical protein
MEGILSRNFELDDDLINYTKNHIHDSIKYQKVTKEVLANIALLNRCQKIKT